MPNIFENIPSYLPEELFETLLQKNGITIERILSEGHHTPEQEWYDQAWDEWVLLLSGQATLRFTDQPDLTLKPGDYLFIPAHQRHQVCQSAPELKTVWLAIHLR